MKAIEQHFHVVLFTMLYKVVLTFKRAIWQLYEKLKGVLESIEFQN